MTKFAWFSRSITAIPVLVSLLIHPIATAPVNLIPKVNAKTVHYEEKKIKPKKIRLKHKLVLKMTTPARYTSAQVSSYIITALRLTHEPRTWSKPLYWVAYQESRFYSRAVDGVPAKNVDLAGDSEHAEGLMQVVPSTFRRHAIKGMQNIWDPIDNESAAIRYIRGRYGSPYKIPGVFRADQYNGY